MITISNADSRHKRDMISYMAAVIVAGQVASEFSDPDVHDAVTLARQILAAVDSQNRQDCTTI